LQRRATRGSAGFATIATLPAGTTSYADTNVTQNWEYNYRLMAVVNGVSTNIAGVHTQVQKAPVGAVQVDSGVARPASASASVSLGTASPTNFVATSPSKSAVDLSWTDNTNGAAAYVLQRRATNGAGAFQTIATIAPGIASYSDKAVARNWQYQYRLVAVTSGVGSQMVETQVQVNNVGSSAGTAVVKAPAAPTMLLAASPDAQGIELSWVDHTGGSAQYILGRRATYGGGGYEVIATLTAGTTHFKDVNVAANSEYDYYVQAVTTTGAASPAATVQVRAETLPQFQFAKSA
jgi:fibronectin type 3 domain-containing protein